ncbi:MAG TPA: tetratricopeptide repeat protein [Chthonomonadaceae bacterium]|nr:tetratricopeptide repeat protein [Chthonomonadaceae bacterium]
MMNLPWTIELFGGLSARSRSETITRFATHKTAALLAYLAYHREQQHPREALIELLWPACEPSTGRNRLNNLLSLIRRLLEPPGTPSGTVVLADHHQVSLQCELLTTDVAAFEALLHQAGQAAEGAERLALLQQALALYKSGLLPGFYDEWVLQEQARLSARYGEALYTLARSLYQTHALERALEAVQKVLTVDPYHEPASRLQMRLHAALGQPAAAQQCYLSLEQRFREELGVVPSAKTRTLAEGIRCDPRAASWKPTPAASTQPPPATSGQRAVETASPPTPPSPPSAPPVALHLPPSLNRFFGREEQIEQLQTWLTEPERRLITLTGPGGAGKTRLALEVARRSAPAFRGRVWFVDLAMLQDGRLLPFALVHTLQVALAPQSDPLEQAVRKLQEGPSLLILDNFEHLLRAGPMSRKSETPASGESVLLVRLLLEQAVDLKCVITSRQPLNLAGEQELSVPMLLVPLARESPARLAEYAGVALYLDRARAVRPDFALTAQNGEAVAALCRRLEGMPLSIEMAAAWARTLPPGKMLERLERQLDLLISRRRDLPGRQQSLRATLEWSYDLLEPELRRCFALLSVFRGGFQVEAAEALCGESALLSLAELQERSLVLGEEEGEGRRYRLLESMREFASEKLTESNACAEAKQRHAAFYLALAEEAQPHMNDAEQALWLTRLEAEHGNLRAALEWSLDAPGGNETALRFCVALHRFWQTRGHLAEGRRWCVAALAQPESQKEDELRAKAVAATAMTALFQGDYPAARSLFEENLAFYRKIGDKSNTAYTLSGLGSVVGNQGDYPGACAYHTESLTLYREEGNRAGIATALGNLGNMAVQQGDPRTAITYLEESLSLQEETGNTYGISAISTNLGIAAMFQGDYETAQTYLERSLTLLHEIGDRRTLAHIQGNLGLVLFLQGDYRAARARFEEGLTAGREVGDKVGIVYFLSNLGIVSCHLNDAAAAHAYLKESLPLLQEIGNRSLSIFSLGGFAYLALLQHHPEHAVRLLAAMEELKAAAGITLLPYQTKEVERVLALTRQELSMEVFAAQGEAGRQLTLEQAMAEALR